MERYIGIAVIVVIATIVGAQALDVITSNFAEIHFGVDVIFSESGNV